MERSCSPRSYTLQNLNLHSSRPLPQFFKLYTELLKSDNYVTRRQSLKLLGELLLDRSNVKIMMQVFTADSLTAALIAGSLVAWWQLPGLPLLGPHGAIVSRSRAAGQHELERCNARWRQSDLAGWLVMDPGGASLHARTTSRCAALRRDEDSLCLMMNLLKGPAWPGSTATQPLPTLPAAVRRGRGEPVPDDEPAQGPQPLHPV